MTFAKNKDINDAFLMGAVVALGCVYACYAEGAAEEIVRTFGASGLLRVAKSEGDISLPNLRKTIGFLASRTKQGNRKRSTKVGSR